MYGAVIGAVYSGTATLNLNGCVVENTTVKGQPSGALYGSYEDGDVIIIDGNKLITSAEDFINAVKNGGTVILGADIAMTTTITPGKSFVIEGNGYTITMADGCVNTYSLFDSIPEGVTAVFNNLTFDGIKGGAILRSIGAEVVMNNVTVQNCDHTQIQGLLRLAGKNTLTNCTFKNNSASMIVTFNYDARYDQPQLVENCVFENNTCKDTAVLYYVKGIGCTLNGNKFINNNVTSTANGATVYMGFTEHNVITNNVFSGNTVVSTGTSKRVSGGIMIGYEAVITGNAFVNNSVSNSAGTALGNDVCASVYYTDIDLSGNYWGGNAPVQNENYFVEYTNHSVIINDYLTSIEE